MKATAAGVEGGWRSESKFVSPDVPPLKEIVVRGKRIAGIEGMVE